MEKQKVKVGMEHFKTNLSGMKCCIVFFFKHLMNEYLMKNYGDRVGCYPSRP